MEWKVYKVSGKYIPTNRKRTVKVISTSQERAESIALTEHELNPPFSVTTEDFPPPSEKQISLAISLGIRIPANANFEDVSCLISKVNERDRSDPNPELVDFAVSRNIFHSKYIGKKRLYNIIYSSLQPIDKAAFWVFSVYRWLSEDRRANLDVHPYKDMFYAFADSTIDDKRFMRYISGRDGQALRYFGTIISCKNGYANQYSGTNDTTYAYNKAADFVSDNFGTPKTRVKTFDDGIPLKNKRRNAEYGDYSYPDSYDSGLPNRHREYDSYEDYRSSQPDFDVNDPNSNPKNKKADTSSGCGCVIGLVVFLAVMGAICFH